MQKLDKQTLNVKATKKTLSDLTEQKKEENRMR